MDDKSKRAPQDAKRINVNEDYEVRFSGLDRWPATCGRHWASRPALVNARKPRVGGLANAGRGVFARSSGVVGQVSGGNGRKHRLGRWLIVDAAGDPSVEGDPLIGQLNKLAIRPERPDHFAWREA
jgi:hypothetical protein